MSETESMTPAVKRLWSAYLQQCCDPENARRRFYEVFRIGSGAADSDAGAREILAGRKTATSSLLWEYEAGGGQPPSEGALSILTDGQGRPQCVVETTWLRVMSFDRVDAAFARDYGEWDGSLETWRRECWAYYAAQCAELGCSARADMPLVCERFRVVFVAAD